MIGYKVEHNIYPGINTGSFSLNYIYTFLNPCYFILDNPCIIYIVLL